MAQGDLAAEIAVLKQRGTAGILVYGGAGFVSSLVKEGLIDEFNFFINPVMVNKGMRIFGLDYDRRKLSLMNSTAYDCGITVLCYKAKKRMTLNSALLMISLKKEQPAAGHWQAFIFSITY